VFSANAERVAESDVVLYRQLDVEESQIIRAVEAMRGGTGGPRPESSAGHDIARSAGPENTPTSPTDMVTAKRMATRVTAITIH